MTDQASLFDGGPVEQAAPSSPPPRPPTSSTVDPDGFGFDYWHLLWAAARKGNKP